MRPARANGRAWSNEQNATPAAAAIPRRAEFRRQIRGGLLAWSCRMIGTPPAQSGQRQHLLRKVEAVNVIDIRGNAAQQLTVRSASSNGRK